MREKIFVSYSHKDKAWLDIVRNQLGTGTWAEAFEMCCDEDIAPGTAWEQKITAAIASSRVALLLVSDNFLASDFIFKKELKLILKRNEVSGQPEGLSIWWILLDGKYDRNYEEELQRARIGKFQAAIDPSTPLVEMNERERAAAIRELGTKLNKEFKSLCDTSATARNDLRRKVAETLASVNTVINEPFEPGDNSIIYRAKRQDNAEVAIKALIPSPNREWLGKDFIDRANSVRNIANATAIGIRDIFDREIKCVVMEWVSSPTLKVPHKESCPSCAQTAAVLAQLAGVAADLHRMEGQPIIGPIRPSHVHYDRMTRKARISLVHIANETLKSCQQRPTLLLDKDALTTLSPERYFGRKIDAFADQYYLGLLGLELLLGKPPVEVSTFADLESKRRFFDSPREFFGDLLVKEPAFSFVLTKMLEQDPQKRWTSMSNLAEALQELAKGNVPAVVKSTARADYRNKLRGNKSFFDSFYRGLLTQSDEIREIFFRRRVNMDEQCKKLDDAVRSLFSFDPSVELTTLDDQAESHRKLGLKAEHFDLFRATFLEVLHNAQITDVYSEDAWRALLNPAISFMSAKASSEPVKLAS